VSALPTPPSLADDIHVAAAEARAHVAAVDRDGRFPREALDLLRTSGALAALVPRSLGGPEVPPAEIAAACYELARACPATGMVFAMHQIQVGCLVDRCASEPFFRRYLSELVSRPALIASATSEVGVGGDLRRSICAVEPDGDGVRLEKAGPTLSYGAHADDYLITARRAEKFWDRVKQGAIDVVSVSDKVPAAVKDKLATVKHGLADGSFAIWKGPIVDQAGKEVLAASQVADDKFLLGINFYVKGVQGKLPSAQ